MAEAAVRVEDIQAQLDARAKQTKDEAFGKRVGDAAKEVRKKLEGVTLVVLDPPRSGAAEAIEPLLQIAAPRIVYVSCDPATLARDLRALSSAYRLVEVRPFDLFPQTYHLESVSLLVRAA